MKVLSVYWSLCSGAALFDSDRIVAATHEERFTRRKNDQSFPAKSIDYCLREAGVVADDLDGVCLPGFVVGFDDIITGKYSHWTVDDYVREQREIWLPYFNGTSSERKPLLQVFPAKLTDTYPGADYWNEMCRKPAAQRASEYNLDRERIVASYLGIERTRVRRLDHHECHASYAYYAAPFREQPVLALTIDGWGDHLNATIGVVDELGRYTRVFGTEACGIGRLYRYMTLLLGMRPNEHEYKLMGLAPYGKHAHAQRALELFRSTLRVDGLDFVYDTKPDDSYFWFRDRLEGVRFDNLAYAVQTYVEELLCAWVANAVERFGISTVVISGGVAMNVKAMGKIAELPSVERLFVPGSGGDESLAIGAAYSLAERLTAERGHTWNARNVRSLPNLYLGPAPERAQEHALAADVNRSKVTVTADPSADRIARLLSEGKVVARCVGRMEFGQRALGNRSILADPALPSMRQKINEQIKNRDFWMPFAPLVMDRYAGEYLNNPKHLATPHMSIGLPTTAIGRRAMDAACHPADGSARPQILARDDNPELYALLVAFEMLTGRGALLNTSFNLHGFPIVNTVAEAYDVFMRSGLDCLLLSGYLFEKR